VQDPEDWGTQHTQGGGDGDSDPRGGGGGKGDGDFRSLLSSLPGITEEAPFELRALEVGSMACTEQPCMAAVAGDRDQRTMPAVQLSRSAG